MVTEMRLSPESPLIVSTPASMTRSATPRSAAPARACGAPRNVSVSGVPPLSVPLVSPPDVRHRFSAAGLRLIENQVDSVERVLVILFGEVLSLPPSSVSPSPSNSGNIVAFIAVHPIGALPPSM